MTKRQVKPVDAAQSRTDPAALGVSIYQNPDYVVGLLQQMVQRGLITVEEIEHKNEAASGDTRSKGARADVDAGANAGPLGRLSIAFGAEGSRAQDSSTSSGAVLRQRLEYSQAYYLFLVRRLLNEAKRVKSLSGLADARDLVVGDFVEYQARFRADEAGAILDVATPELAAAVARYVEHRRTIGSFDSIEGGYDGLQVHLAKRRIIEEGSAEFARAVAAAVRVDFRSDATRQYYGEVGQGDDLLHAITICETEHFITRDEDRLLDGTFTVLGKVVTAPEENPPIFDPNKLLRRVNPTYLEHAFEKLHETTEAAATQRLPDEVTDAPAVDVTFRARIDGTAIKVLPVAIYA